MSAAWTPTEQAAAPQAPAAPCPRCGAPLADDQDWCLRCGDPARTVIAATPRWRRPIAALVAIAALALGVLAAAFVALTDDDPPAPRTITTTTTLAPGALPAPGTRIVPPSPTTAAPPAPAPGAGDATPAP